MTARRQARPEADPEQVAEMTEAYAAAFGHRGQVAYMQQLVEIGFPVHRVPLLASLTNRASHETRPLLGDVESVLVTAANHLPPPAAPGWTPEHADTWLTMVAAAGDRTRVYRAALALTRLNADPDPAAKPGTHWAPWLTLTATRGPLVWAAGLTPTEAADRSEADLAAMAALRGWRWRTQRGPALPA